MRPSTPLSASWIVVGADGTEQQLPSPRPGGGSQAAPAGASGGGGGGGDDASLGPSELSQSQGSLSLNPEDVEALSSAMLAAGVGMPLEEEAEPQDRDQAAPVPAASAGEGEEEDAVARAKRWASHLVRHLRSLAAAIVASLEQATAYATNALADTAGFVGSGKEEGSAAGAAAGAGAKPIVPRPRLMLAIALPVTAATLAILVSLCRAEGGASVGGMGAAHQGNGTAQALAASLAGRGLGCCRSEGLLGGIVHVDAATPLCVHVF